MSGSSSTRTPLAAANWKMHLLARQASALCAALRTGLGESAGPSSATAAEVATACDVAVFPSFPLLPAVAEALAGSRIGLGGQDLHCDDQGAHTGDVSGPQLRDAGCAWVLVGHSERRQNHHESDGIVARKLEAAGRNGLRPILCLGETREERHAGRTFQVLERQLAIAAAAAPDDWVIAYEPVWAIGTGETATPEQAQEAHAFLRGCLAEIASHELAQRMRILYGGSVKPENAAELIAQRDLDGFLVGGASLDAAKFLAIIQACAGAGR